LVYDAAPTDADADADADARVLGASDPLFRRYPFERAMKMVFLCTQNADRYISQNAFEFLDLVLLDQHV